MSNSGSKVLGYIAMIAGTTRAVSSQGSVVVAGSEKQLREYIAIFASDRAAKYHITKARYGPVIQAIKLGHAYSFDQDGFSRLRPLAQAEGINLPDFTPANQDQLESAIPLMRVQSQPKMTH